MDGGSGGKQKKASSIFTDRGCLDFMNFEQLNVFNVSRRRNLYIGTDIVFLTHIGIARSEGHTEFNMTVQIYMNEREKKRKFHIFLPIAPHFRRNNPNRPRFAPAGTGRNFHTGALFSIGKPLCAIHNLYNFAPVITLHFIPEKQKEK